MQHEQWTHSRQFFSCLVAFFCFLVLCISLLNSYVLWLMDLLFCDLAYASVFSVVLMCGANRQGPLACTFFFLLLACPDAGDVALQIVDFEDVKRGAAVYGRYSLRWVKPRPESGAQSRARWRVVASQRGAPARAAQQSAAATAAAALRVGKGRRRVEVGRHCHEVQQLVGRREQVVVHFPLGCGPKLRRQ